MAEKPSFQASCPVSQDMMESYVEPSPCALTNPTKIYIITNISESIRLYWRCPSMVLGSHFQASCPVSQDMMEAYKEPSLRALIPRKFT
jgi:hypothetical protein